MTQAQASTIQKPIHHRRKSPADVYQEIKVTIPADLPERVLEILRERIGKDNRVTRPELVELIFGIPRAEVNLYSSTLDRQIREVIATLQGRYPIISSSGSDGYWWPASMDEVNAYAGEIQSRATALFEKSQNVLRAAQQLFHEPPQMRLPGL